MDILTVKIICMILLGGVSITVGLIPMLFKRCLEAARSGAAGGGGGGGGGGLRGGRRRKKSVNKWDYAIACLSCFGGGVILTTALTHMLPEVNVFVRMNIRDGTISNSGVPLAEILVLCGFFMIYVVEEITHIIIDRFHHKNHRRSHSQDGSDSNSTNGDGPEEHEAMVEKSDHDHAPVDLLASKETESQFQAALRGFLVILALSLHAVFEGIALGLTSTANSVWFLFFAISSHKYVISFCCGMQFVSSGVKPILVILYVATFSLISPLGAGIGIALSENGGGSDGGDGTTQFQSPLITVLQGLATGTLLYVVFFEVLEKERQKQTLKGIVQITFIILGFACMIGLEQVELSQQVNGPPILMSTTSLTCRAEYESVSKWSFPLNVTCYDGVLTPS